MSNSMCIAVVSISNVKVLTKSKVLKIMLVDNIDMCI